MADTDQNQNPDAPSDTDDTPDKGTADEAAKWKALARKHEKESKALADRLKALEDKDKSELDKLRDENAQLKKDAEDAAARALRLEVASEKGVKPRWLTGTTREELEAAADEYLADHPPASSTGPVPDKPVTDLKGGGDPTEEPPVDVREVVDSIPRGM